MLKALAPRRAHIRLLNHDNAQPILTGFMITAAALLWLYIAAAGSPAGLAHTTTPQTGVWAAALVATYTLAEARPLRIKIRNEYLLLPLSEIPTVVGLLRAGPPWVTGAAALTAAALVYTFKREKPRNAVMNLAFTAAEFGAAAAMVTAFRNFGFDIGGMYIALAVGLPIGALLTGGTIAVTHRALGNDEPVGHHLLRAIISSGSTTVLALVGFTLWFGPPGTPLQGSEHKMIGRVLAVGLAVALAVLYRVYAEFLRRQEDLARVYAFGSVVVAAGAGPAEWVGILQQLRGEFDVEQAILTLRDPLSEMTSVVASARDGHHGTVVVGDLSDPLFAAAEQHPGGLLLNRDQTADSATAAALDARGCWEAVCIPLHSGDRSVGYLEIRDRRARWQRLGDKDVALLDAFGQHMATALDRLGLVDSLRHEANHDALTGLLNMRGLVARINDHLAGGGAPAVVVLEVGVLADVNNAIGHARGDEMLAAAAGRIRALPDCIAAARLESDRFAFLIADSTPDQVAATAADLVDMMKDPFILTGVELDPYPQAGVAVADAGHAGPDRAVTLIQQAEMALAVARTSDDRIRPYNTDLGGQFLRRFQLITQFRKAIEAGDIQVYYQPQMVLADNRVSSMEALVRWTHPDLGSVPPFEFVAAIEATGAIDTLFDHVLEIVLQQIAAWRRRRLTVTVAVNLSARNLTNPDLPDRIRAALQRHAVDPAQLMLEITESCIMTDPAKALPMLDVLHGMGIKLAVDDFGTGYSSLAYLRRLPVDEIKIDKTFIQGMDTGLVDLAIVKSIIGLGNTLGLDVVAEGVEQEATRDLLTQFGCTKIQGYLLSRPQPIGTLEAWITARTVRTLLTPTNDNQLVYTA